MTANPLGKSIVWTSRIDIPVSELRINGLYIGAIRMGIDGWFRWTYYRRHKQDSISGVERTMDEAKRSFLERVHREGGLQ